MTPHSVENAFIRFTGDNGFSRNADTVSLFAERIDNLNNSDITSGSLALQLWACPAPYSGGELSGWKLAELALGILQAEHFIAPVASEVPAYFPESGEYVVVLVIAEWDGEGYYSIHDFRNFPCSDIFPQPRLEGLLGYRCTENGRLVINVERIRNPRDLNNLSGTLSLELWALSEPYVVGDFAGHALAGVTLGSLRGNESWQSCSYDLAISQPPPGTYTLVLMLREWTGSGYVTRDHSNFQDRVTFPLVIPQRSFPEAAIMNNSGDEVLDPAPPDATAAIAVPKRTEHATDETEPPLTESGAQRGTSRRIEDRSVYALLANVRGFTQWAMEKLKRQLLV